jgi:predicted ATPase
VSVKLGDAGDDFSYSVEFGLPTPSRSAFSQDPEIKREVIWHGPVCRAASALVDRRGSVVSTRGTRST